jgi:ubiquinone/menaquinone biosynthesis C-methylase UbiE
MKDSAIEKADYSKIAKVYDDARPLSEKNITMWINLVAEKINREDNISLLDLGCGTGRFTIPFASQLGYTVTGTDASEDMILKASLKKGAERVMWAIQDATSLLFPSDAFDVVFMSHLLHHIDAPAKILSESYRVLKPGGVLLNRYGALEDLNDPEHVFFPETIKIDQARCATKPQMEKWFQMVGFSRVSSETILQQTYQSAEERLKVVQLKSTSVLTLINNEAYEKGVTAFHQYITQHPDDPWLLMDKITLTIGYKE